MAAFITGDEDGEKVIRREGRTGWQDLQGKDFTRRYGADGIPGLHFRFVFGRWGRDIRREYYHLVVWLSLHPRTRSTIPERTAEADERIDCHDARTSRTEFLFNAVKARQSYLADETESRSRVPPSSRTVNDHPYRSDGAVNLLENNERHKPRRFLTPKIRKSLMHRYCVTVCCPRQVRRL
jgi:hypothetical protein